MDAKLLEHLIKPVENCAFCTKGGSDGFPRKLNPLIKHVLYAQKYVIWGCVAASNRNEKSQSSILGFLGSSQKYLEILKNQRKSFS